MNILQHFTKKKKIHISGIPKFWPLVEHPVDVTGHTSATVLYIQSICKQNNHLYNVCVQNPEGITVPISWRDFLIFYNIVISVSKFWYISCRSQKILSILWNASCPFLPVRENTNTGWMDKFGMKVLV